MSFPTRLTHSAKITLYFTNVASSNRLPPTPINLDPFFLHKIFYFQSFRLASFRILTVVKRARPKMTKEVTLTAEHLTALVSSFERTFDFFVSFRHYDCLENFKMFRNIIPYI